MTRLFEKILHEIKAGISFSLAFLATITVFCINPNVVFQYCQNKILAFILVFFFFYTFFLIVYKIYSWIKEMRAIARFKEDEKNKRDMTIAIKIRDTHLRIREEFFNCYSKGDNKISRTHELDHLIFCCGLRSFFEPNKYYYVVNQDVLRAIKKYHRIVFEDLYWSKKYEKK